MKKKLIGAHNVRDYIDNDQKTLCLSAELILSPGARDYLRNHGITVVYSRDTAPAAKPAQKKIPSAAPATGQSKKADQAKLVTQVVTLLRQEYGIVAEEQLSELCLQVMKRLNK